MQNKTWISDLNMCECMLLIYYLLETVFAYVYSLNFILSSARFRLQCTYWIIYPIGSKKCTELICSHKQLAKFRQYQLLISGIHRLANKWGLEWRSKNDVTEPILSGEERHNLYPFEITGRIMPLWLESEVFRALMCLDTQFPHDGIVQKNLCGMKYGLQR